MNKQNIALTILALIILGWVLLKCLATAWVGMKMLPLVFTLVACVVIGWLWGKFTK